jgi:hypothetical protein
VPPNQKLECGFVPPREESIEQLAVGNRGRSRWPHGLTQVL